MPMTHVSWGDFNAGDKVSWKTVTTNNGSILCWDVSNWFSERRGRLEREQERSRCCFVVNTFYDLSPDHTGETFLLVLNISVEIWPFFFKKIEKNIWGNKVNSREFSIFWVWLAGFLPGLFLWVQFNSVRCWSWSEFKYYRKEKTSSHRGKTSHIHLSPSTSHLCYDFDKVRFRLTRLKYPLHYPGENKKPDRLNFPVVYSWLLRLFRMKNE